MAPPTASTRAKLATGAVSGLVACVTLQPADLLKTRLQEDARRATASNRTALEGRTARLVRVSRGIVRTDGVRGLWRGTAPTVVRNVPGVALYLTSVAEVRRAVVRGSLPLLSFLQRPAGGGLTTTGDLLTGGATRVAVGFVLAPVTVAKTRMESAHFGGHNAAYRTVWGSLRAIYTTQGIPGLWQGFGATAVRDAPYAGLYLALYQHTKRVLASAAARARTGAPRGEGLVNQALALQSAGAGMIAGALATVLTHPFDVLKTRAQTYRPPGTSDNDLVGSASREAGVRPPGMLRTARDMLKNEPGAFLDGIGLRCARKAASSAIAWCIFEVGSSAFAAHATRSTHTLAQTDTAKA